MLVGRLFPNPFEESGDFRMGCDFINRIVISFQLLLGEQGVNLLMAGGAKENGFLAFFARGIPTRALIVVPGARNQVMPGQMRGEPFA